MPTVSTFTTLINSFLPEPHASLLSGMLFGVRRSMPDNFYDALVITGVLHVIALSGQNIAILMQLVAQTALPYLGRKRSVVLTLILIVMFILFVGVSASIVRAGLMGALALLAVYFGRLNWSLLTLCIASGIMLLVRPDWIHDISFQLSFAATLGIILCGPRQITPLEILDPHTKHLEVEQKPITYSQILGDIRAFLWHDLRLTLSAQIFTIPLIMWYFGRISLISPLANLAVGWVVPLIMSLGLPIVFVGWLTPPMGRIGALILWVPLSYFITVVNIFAKLPFASISF